MKKLYYIFAFLSIPLVMLLLTVLDQFIVLNYVVFCTAFTAAAIVLALFSPSRRMFDWHLAIIFPMSLLVTMFTVHFLDAGETYVRFDPAHAARVLLRSEPLPYIFVAVAAFAASCRYIRMPPQKRK